jgi:hypothetical protein
VDAEKASHPHTMLDAIGRQAGTVELLERNHPVLARGDPRYDLVGAGDSWAHQRL